MTMLEYITRQRVSHAQRLLATTDRGVLNVMQECGFTSPTRFYAVFLRFAGSTPGDYRRPFQPVGNRRGKTDKTRARVRRDKPLPG